MGRRSRKGGLSIPGVPAPPPGSLKTPGVAAAEKAAAEKKEMCEALWDDLDATRNRVTGRPHGYKGKAAMEALTNAGCVDDQEGGRRTSKIGTKFSRCVKSVRKTVRARPKSTKESAAIAICTTSVLHPRGRTIKRYSKKRLVTQKLRR